MSTPTAEAPAKGKQTVALRPFTTGSRTIESENYNETVTQNTGTQAMRVYNFETDGFLSGAFIRITGTTAANAATTAFNADGPFNVIQSLIFSDIGGKQIIGPITGWDLYVLNKFGGFAYSGDAKSNAVYSITTGAGATGGSFRFVLRLPVQFRKRDATGSLSNRNASATFRVQVTINNIASVYSTAPTSAPSINVRIAQFGWMSSDSRDYKGTGASPTPNGIGSLAYVDKESITLSTGAVNQRLATFGGLLRMMIFELRDSTGSRAQGESDWFGQFQLEIDKTKPYDRTAITWDHILSEDFGLSATAESVTAGGTRINGVRPLYWTDDYGLQPGAESSFRYQPVTPSTSMIVRGSIGGAGEHTLNVLKQYIAAVGDDPRALTGGR
jgi:hypothetical protein